MSFVIIFIVVAIVGVLIAVIGQTTAINLDAMSPEQRNTYHFGPININLVCPHCQTKGTIHAKQVIREITSKGKVGGILKTNTTTTTTTAVTQHHCDQCNSTWDI